MSLFIIIIYSNMVINNIEPIINFFIDFNIWAPLKTRSDY